MLDRLGFPQPWLSLTLFVTWQFLSDGISGGSVVLGIILAWGIPQWDIIVASVEVAKLILSPRQPRPMFICYPLELEHPLAISVLVSTISLTPGTVGADVSDDNKLILIHSLDADDEQAVIDTIRTRYEKPLLEMFQ